MAERNYFIDKYGNDSWKQNGHGEWYWDNGYWDRDYNNPFTRCRAFKKKGQSKNRCKKLAGAGTGHDGYGVCRIHGGSDEIVERVWKMAFDISKELDITPWEALLLVVRKTAGRANWIDHKLEEVLRETDGNNGSVTLFNWMKESRYERKLMMSAAVAAIQSGVEERMVRQIEMEGELVTAAAIAAIDALGLTPDQRLIALAAGLNKLKSIESTKQEKTIMGELE